ncbi:MAG: hypothetical protein EXS29_02330 [Pedosphaera sp.]|nr:hypothetical protein [Pedosphaera sp.]
MPTAGTTTRKPLLSLTFLLGSVAVLLLLAVIVYWRVYRAPALFAKTAANPKPDVIGSALAAAKRLNYVQVNPLAAVRLAQEGAEVRLPLFRGETHTFLVEQVSQNQDGSTTSVGPLKGQPESQAILVAGGGSLAGSIHFPDGRLYVLYPLPNQVLAVMEVAAEFQPDCDHTRSRPIYSPDGKAVMAFQTVRMDRAIQSGRIHLRQPTVRPSSSEDLKSSFIQALLRRINPPTSKGGTTTTVTTTTKPTVSKPTPPSNPNGGTTLTLNPAGTGTNNSRATLRSTPPGSGTIDILAAYTPGAVAKHGGVTNVQNMINLAVAQANTAFQNSQIKTTLRLVHAVQVQHSASSIIEDLTAITSGSAPEMKQLHQLRKQHKADLVSIFTEAHGSSAVGVAWLGTSSMPQYGFSAVELWATPMMTFAHEVGHNLGCAHNMGDKGIYNDSVGHRFSGANGTNGTSVSPQGQTLYRSVMSYSPGARVLHFSNPSVQYKGTATGVTGTADNARTINQTTATISKYSDSLQ